MLKRDQRMNGAAWRRKYNEIWNDRTHGRALMMYHNMRKRTSRPVTKAMITHLERELDRGTCALCGLPFGVKHDMRLSPSVDKIESKGHYSVANTQLVHFECNRIKGEFPQVLVQPMIKKLMRLVYGRISKAEARRLGAAFAAAGRGKEKGKAATPKH